MVLLPIFNPFVRLSWLNVAVTRMRLEVMKRGSRCVSWLPLVQFKRYITSFKHKVVVHTLQQTIFTCDIIIVKSLRLVTLYLTPEDKMLQHIHTHVYFTALKRSIGGCEQSHTKCKPYLLRYIWGRFTIKHSWICSSWVELFSLSCEKGNVSDQIKKTSLHVYFWWESGRFHSNCLVTWTSRVKALKILMTVYRDGTLRLWDITFANKIVLF